MNDQQNEILQGYGKTTQKVYLGNIPNNKGVNRPAVFVPLANRPVADPETTKTVSTQPDDPRLTVLEEHEKCIRKKGINGDIVIVWLNADNSIGYFSKTNGDLRAFFRRTDWGAIMALPTRDVPYPC